MTFATVTYRFPVTMHPLNSPPLPFFVKELFCIQKLAPSHISIGQLDKLNSVRIDVTVKIQFSAAFLQVHLMRRLNIVTTVDSIRESFLRLSILSSPISNIAPKSVRMSFAISFPSSTSIKLSFRSYSRALYIPLIDAFRNGTTCAYTAFPYQIMSSVHQLPAAPPNPLQYSLPYQHQ